MKAYDDLFAAPIALTVLMAIAALVHREIPTCIALPMATTARIDVACEA